MSQTARNLNHSVEGTGNRYLIHDEIRYFTKWFLSTLKEAGVKSVRPP
jgi:hypothetical protein